jgi:hypothetical protein
MGVMGVQVAVGAITLLEVMDRRVKEITAVGVPISAASRPHTVIRVGVVEERDR